MHPYKIEKILELKDKLEFQSSNEVITYKFGMPLNLTHHFYSNVQAFQKKYKNYTKICLAQEDIFDFSCAFFAAISMGKSILILPNYKLGTLKKYESEYDYFSTEKAFKTNHTNSIPKSLSLKLNTTISLFTSGSNGKPKKIVKLFKNLWFECENLERHFGNQIAGSIIAGSVSHFHIYGLIFRILWPFYANRKIENHLIFFPEDLSRLKNINENITFISSPAFLKRMVHNFKHFTKPIKIFSSGGPLEQNIAKQINKYTQSFPVEIYGSTETGGIAYRNQNDNNNRWTIFEGIKVSTDIQGCLKVTSPYIPNYDYQTSDLATIFTDKKIALRGRIDRTFKIEEKRISLDHMENILRGHDSIDDAYCLILNKNDRDFIAVIIAENAKWNTLSKLDKIKRIKSFLNLHFENVLLPKKFHFLREMPYNEQSKIVKSDVIGIFNEQ